MTLKSIYKNKTWSNLQTHANLLSSLPKISNSLFQANACNIHLNYMHQHVTQETLKLLFNLAEHTKLRQRILALMQGEKLNQSENKPALHSALRAPAHTFISANNINVMPEIEKARENIFYITEKIRSNNWVGYSGKPITDVVNIGIGGSFLGAQFCLAAFHELILPSLNFHFISECDPSDFQQVTAKLNPETTLFIVSSKSFTTTETIFNAKKAMCWIGPHSHSNRNFIAVTADINRAMQFGFKTILPIWDWVGGRYSLCSAINLITAIAIGYEAFEQLLMGAYHMDMHFREAEFHQNLPVLLALLGIWNNNFLAKHNLLILTYAKSLQYFTPYIQQLDMESNGKSIDNNGRRVNYATGPIIWGGSGNQAQHSYYQLLCQGTPSVAADFITIDALNSELINQLCNRQIQVLTSGIQTNNIDHIHGNLPLNHIQIKDKSPFTIGALIAMYEHKVFTQSVIWNINPFDQPGVENSKKCNAQLV